MEPVKRLTLDDKLKVSYCIPQWLKIEQVKANIAKVPGRIKEVTELRTDPIALVNFGPSLRDTWEKIKDFKFVMTCSGAHKFMVDHGVIPTWDINVDPRAHKVGLMGQPQKETEYLVASTCSPKLIEHLAGFNIKLWHIFDNEEEGFRLMPHGDWQITGGCSVGVRTMTLARFLGFTEFHIFGMDGSVQNGNTHASEHPNAPKSYCVLEYEGKEYHTTPSMLEAVKNTWHELDMMKDTKAKFYGETGLVQAMAKNYVRKELPKGGQIFIAFNKPELISADYRELNRKLHADNLAYGVGGGRHAPTVIKLMDSLKKDVQFPSCLDYGAGKMYLQKALDFPIWNYDPAIPEISASPKPADLVCCLDVLEHIERERLDFVLDDLRRCVKRIGFFVIHTGPASKTLADGRNAHLVQEPAPWWKGQLERFFSLASNSMIEKPPLVYFVVSPKKKPTKVASTI